MAPLDDNHITTYEASVRLRRPQQPITGLAGIALDLWKICEGSRFLVRVAQSDLSEIEYRVFHSPRLKEFQLQVTTFTPDNIQTGCTVASAGYDGAVLSYVEMCLIEVKGVLAWGMAGRSCKIRHGSEEDQQNAKASLRGYVVAIGRSKDNLNSPVIE